METFENILLQLIYGVGIHDARPDSSTVVYDRTSRPELTGNLPKLSFAHKLSTALKDIQSKEKKLVYKDISIQVTLKNLKK